MKSSKLIFGIFLLCISFISCEKDDDNNSLDYNQEVIISAILYNTAPSDFLTINNVVLRDDYLKINFSSGGCSGESWEIKLIDADVILESYPPQRNLRLSLKNEELCEAYITKEISFDISELQVDGNQVLLNINNFESQILYVY
ncbi:MAG: hypothetical protein GQ564_17125 [Bacteroidales bacterium]|nr:hypothetical protein [Bacteroidales bacterium]